jgi:hypothetical protein
VHLAAGLVQGLDRRAGQLDLAARLEGDAGAPALEGNRPALLPHHLPAELSSQALQQRPDTALALVRQWPQVIVGIAELLVLGADPPLGLGLAPGREVLDQLTAIGDRRALLLRRRGHAELPFSRRRGERSWDSRCGNGEPYRGAARACQACPAAAAPPSVRAVGARQRGRRPQSPTLAAGAQTSVRPPPGVPSC